MSFDRLLFSASFAAVLFIAVAAAVQSPAPAVDALAEPAAVAVSADTPSLERVVVVGQRDASRI